MKIKSLFALILTAGLFALALPAQAQADSKTVAGLNGELTDAVAAVTSTSYNSDISVAKSGNLTLAVEFKLASAGTGNTFFSLVPTDGAGNTNTIAANNIVFSVAANGTTIQRCLTNFNVGAVPGYRLVVGNTNAAIEVRNISVKAITKNGI